MSLKRLSVACGDDRDQGEGRNRGRHSEGTGGAVKGGERVGQPKSSRFMVKAVACRRPNSSLCCRSLHRAEVCGRYEYISRGEFPNGVKALYRNDGILAGIGLLTHERDTLCFRARLAFAENMQVRRGKLAPACPANSWCLIVAWLIWARSTFEGTGASGSC